MPRKKVKEAWKVYQEKVIDFSDECVRKCSGKYVGRWHIGYVRVGEINPLVAYPTLEDRERFIKMFFEYKDEKFQKGLEEWISYVLTANIRVMRPLPGSALD